MPQPGRRRLPFLHRNWTVGVTACQEWTPKPPPSDDHHRRRADDAAVTTPPPLKRRRIGPVPALLDDVVKLPDYPGDRSNGLRIQVFNIFHEDTPRLRFANTLATADATDVTRFHARFKVSVLSEKCGLPLMMHCAAQIGSVQAVRAQSAASAAYGLARLVLEPFTVPLEQIAILQRDGDVFGLADTYKLRVEIESTASNDAWPPLDLLALSSKGRSSGGGRGGGGGNDDTGDGRPKKAPDCVLYAESSDFVGRPRIRVPLWLRESPQHDAVRTTFVMDMDVRWTTGFLERPRRHLPAGPSTSPDRGLSSLSLGVLPTIVALHPDEPLPLPTLDLSELWPRAGSRSRLRARARAHMRMRMQARSKRLGGGIAAVAAATDSSHHVQNQINSQISRELNGRSAVDGDGHGDEDDVSDDSGSSGVDEYDDGATTIDGTRRALNRSLRARRQQPDYNVRAITNRAHHIRERRKRLAARPFAGLGVHGLGINGAHGLNGLGGLGGIRHLPTGAGDRDVKVTYTYQMEHLTVDGFVCCMCMATNPDIVHLRAHLLTHLHYAFQYDRLVGVRGGGHVFKVSHVFDGSHNSSGRLADHPAATVYQLGRPTRALDLDRFLAGDDTWLTSRFGPENGNPIAAVVTASRLSVMPPQPSASSSSRSKAARAAVAAAVAGMPLATAPPPPPPPPPKKKRGGAGSGTTAATAATAAAQTVLVPQTRQPLYDPLSKALLVPGAALRPTMVDDSWRIHKHREIVQDYTDLTQAEKEFIQEWDRFVILHRVASDAHIPRTMAQFVDAHGLWLVADPARALEFGKLMAVMVAHDILADDADVDRLTAALDAARAHRRTLSPDALAAALATRPSAAPKPYAASSVFVGAASGAGADMDASAAPTSVASSCPLCGLRGNGAGADVVICCNRACTRRLHHTACLGSTAKVDVEQRGEWYCNNCAHLADPDHLVRPLDEAPAAVALATAPPAPTTLPAEAVSAQ